MSNGISGNRPRRLGGYRLYLIVYLSFALIPGAIGPRLYAAEDDYLKAIEMETEKVDARGLAPTSDKAATKRPSSAKKAGGTGGNGLASGLSIEEFEQQLDARFTGSALFYRKLSRSDQETIYEQYLGGASIDEVRKKIMDRFLKR